MKRLLTITFAILISLALIDINPVLAVNLSNGAKIFSVQCAGCHPNGGNIVRRGQNLRLRNLRRHKLDSVETLAYLIANGKNNMSGFKDRLSTLEIQELSAYVLERAEKGWR